MSLTSLNISELQEGYRSKAFTPADVLRALESRIAEVDPKIQAFLSRDFETALKAADTLLRPGSQFVLIES